MFNFWTLKPGIRGGGGCAGGTEHGGTGGGEGAHRPAPVNIKKCWPKQRQIPALRSFIDLLTDKFLK